MQDDQVAFWISTFPEDDLELTQEDIARHFNCGLEGALPDRSDKALLAAFLEFNDAARALNGCTIIDAGTALTRLESARKAFAKLFMKDAE